MSTPFMHHYNITMTSHKRQGVPNYLAFDCLFYNLFRLSAIMASKFYITGPMWRESTGNWKGNDKVEWHAQIISSHINTFHSLFKVSAQSLLFSFRKFCTKTRFSTRLIISKTMLSAVLSSNTVTPLCNDHLYNEICYLWFIQWCILMKTEGTNLLLLTISVFWSSSRWPLAT